MSSLHPNATPEVESLAHELDLSIAALRASLEGCREEALEPGDGNVSQTLEGALDYLGKLAERVHTLIDVACPPALSPLRCSAAEVVHSAVQRLSPELAARVQRGSEAAACIHVDGPAVIRSLVHLIEAASAEGPGRVDLDVLARGDEVHFVVSAPIAPRDEVEAHELQLACLALNVARRDVERSGGRLVITEDDDGTRLNASIALPAHAEASA